MKLDRKRKFPCSFELQSSWITELYIFRRGEGGAPYGHLLQRGKLVIRSFISFNSCILGLVRSEQPRMVGIMFWALRKKEIIYICTFFPLHCGLDIVLYCDDYSKCSEYSILVLRCLVHPL